MMTTLISLSLPAIRIYAQLHSAGDGDVDNLLRHDRQIAKVTGAARLKINVYDLTFNCGISNKSMAFTLNGVWSSESKKRE